MADSASSDQRNEPPKPEESGKASGIAQRKYWNHKVDPVSWVVVRLDTGQLENVGYNSASTNRVRSYPRSRPMITRFRVQNFKALRDITLHLTPIHVLIGPNDTGKTSILEAISALCRSVDHDLAHAFLGSWEGRMLVWQGSSELTTGLTASATNGQGEFDYELEFRFAPSDRQAKISREVFTRSGDVQPVEFRFKDYAASGTYQLAHVGTDDTSECRNAASAVYDALRGVQYYRWIPRLLALPVAPDSKVRYRMEASGFGLARCLDDILGYDRERFNALEKRFIQIFPDVKSIMLKPEPAYRTAADDWKQVEMLQRADGKGIHFRFAGGGPEVSASQASDGLLLVLAYLAVLYLPEPPRVLLLEEPENGIHPKRLQDVLTILRELVAEQSHVQVVLTTHSPYVVDLFKPEEVTLCRRNQDGSISVGRLSESKAVREQLDVFTLGEIWTGEGDDALAEPSGSQEDSAP